MMVLNGRVSFIRPLQRALQPLFQPVHLQVRQLPVPVRLRRVLQPVPLLAQVPVQLPKLCLKV